MIVPSSTIPNNRQTSLPSAKALKLFRPLYMSIYPSKLLGISPNCPSVIAHHLRYKLFFYIERIFVRLYNISILINARYKFVISVNFCNALNKWTCIFIIKRYYGLIGLINIAISFFECNSCKSIIKITHFCKPKWYF